MKLRAKCGTVILIDEEDFERLSKYRWYVYKTKNKDYVAVVSSKKIKGKYKTFAMSREIMNAPTGFDVDHINHNRLDNRKSNLRICTRAQNNQNFRKARRKTSSAFKGVTWHKRDKLWQADLSTPGSPRFIGLFKTEIAAAKAYDKRAKKCFGEFANLNFPESIK